MFKILQVKKMHIMKSSTTLINYIDKYEANNNELIIYEYYIYKDDTSNKVCDYLGNCLENSSSIDKNYLKQHKDDFTEYKHTFKKSGNSYYWYSTEVVK